MKRMYSQTQPLIQDGDEETFNWEHGRAQRQRFECLKCEPHHIGIAYGSGDDHAWPHDGADG